MKKKEVKEKKKENEEGNENVNEKKTRIREEDRTVVDREGRRWRGISQQIE